LRNRRFKPVVTEIARLRSSLRGVERSLRRLAPLLSSGTLLIGGANGNSRKAPRLSPRTRASLVLQGRYMGYMRQLKPTEKARIRKIRETKGVRAAISSARQASRS